MIDQVTAWFNVGAIAILLINVRCLLRAKQLRGYSIWAAIYFTIWAIWGIYAYHKLGLFGSMIASAVLSVVYVFWVGMILWYKRDEMLRWWLRSFK